MSSGSLGLGFAGAALPSALLAAAEKAGELTIDDIATAALLRRAGKEAAPAGRHADHYQALAQEDWRAGERGFPRQAASFANSAAVVRRSTRLWCRTGASAHAFPEATVDAVDDRRSDQTVGIAHG